MNLRSNPHVLSFLKAFVNVASIVVVGVGLVVMLGWVLDVSTLRSILPGLPAIRFNTALCLFLLGCTAWLLQNEQVTPIRKQIGNAFATLVLIISLMTICEYLFGWNLKIDELIVRDMNRSAGPFPGRMSPIAALCSGMSSTALLLIGSRMSQYLSVGVLFLSLAAVTDFIFGFRLLLRNSEYTYSAVQTAAAFILLSLAVFAARPTQGMMKILSSDLPGGRAMRLLLPLMVVFTLFMGWLVEAAEEAGLLDSRQEAIFLNLVLIFVYSPLIYFIARYINKAEEGLVYVNRLYATLSQVNAAIVRIKNQQELFETICTIAVDFGGFRLAWIGLFDPHGGHLTAVAMHGYSGLNFPFKDINTEEMPFKEGLIGLALTSGQAQFSDNLMVDPRMSHWREIAQRDGYGSAAVIPIRQGNQVAGLLNLYAADEGIFMVKEEQNLLVEIGMDISFALDMMETETERKRAEENLQQANAELEQRVAKRTEELSQMNLELAQAIQVKDEFLSTMSHELRTPLNSILGLSESLLEQWHDPLSSHQQKSLRIIESSGHHLLELINDILDLSKIESGKFDYEPQMIDIDELCQASLAFVEEQATRKSIAMDYQGDRTISKMIADPRRLKQILVNLLANAVKFTPERGQVILQVHADSEQDRVQLSVLDSGIGIAPEDLKKLFNPFVQLDSSLNRQHAGTGLGLALVKKLADLHAGSVHVTSEVGKGSCFTVILPWRKADSARPTSSESRGEPLISEQTGTSPVSAEETIHLGIILLAEDNQANILTIGDYLESHGYQVVTANDGLDAIEKAGQIHPNIILMDIQMPGMDGLEAIRRLRADPRFATTPIIALTALTMPGDRERCLEAGADEYLSKPVGLKSLLNTVNELSMRSK